MWECAAASSADPGACHLKILPPDKALRNVLTPSLSCGRVWCGHCHPHNVSSLQSAAITFCAAEMQSPAQTHTEGRPWAGTHRQNRLSSNKQTEKNLARSRVPSLGWDACVKTIPAPPHSLALYTHYRAGSLASLPSGTGPSSWQLHL